jgi:hypothetical protein
MMSIGSCISGLTCTVTRHCPLLVSQSRNDAIISLIVSRPVAFRAFDFIPIVESDFDIIVSVAVAADAEVRSRIEIQFFL